MGQVLDKVEDIIPALTSGFGDATALLNAVNGAIQQYNKKNRN